MSFTGFDGGRAKKLSDYNIHVDSLNYGVVENLHHACMNIIPDDTINVWPQFPKQHKVEVGDQHSGRATRTP